MISRKTFIKQMAVAGAGMGLLGMRPVVSYGNKASSKIITIMHTIGNHEFDNKVEGFVKVAPKANFPYVISNYDFSGAPAMAAFTRRYLIKTVSGVRIGIFGLGVSFENLVLPGLHQGVRYMDALRAAGDTTAELRKKHACDMVICLSHIGYQYENDRVSDRVVASEVDGIDLIIGGHTHTLLEEPELVEKAGKSPTVISQVGHAGVVLGRLDFEFDRGNRIRKLLVGNQRVTSELDWIA